MRAIAESPIEPASWSVRTVGVRFVHGEQVVIDELIRAHRAGAAVTWVRNTVRDCISAARLLRKVGLTPLVFHARFAQADRQAREREVRHIFGEHATDDERRGRILIATQVIEQSLDLDFDVMFSDVAPVDLLIQRVGRLWRHPELRKQRPPGMVCELVVLAPVMTDDPTEDWLKALLPGTNAVYSDTGVVWRTVRSLTESTKIKTPGAIGEDGGVRALVESVYGSDYTPEHIAEAALRAHGRARAEISTATYGTLNVEDGYNGSATGWVNDIRVPTRLGNDQTVIRLARIRSDGTLEPWAEDDGRDFPMWKRWALSEVRVSAHSLPRASVSESKYDGAVADARKDWGKYELEIPVLPLVHGDCGSWAGVLVASGDGRAIHVQYSVSDGLVVGG